MFIYLCDLRYAILLPGPIIYIMDEEGVFFLINSALLSFV